MKEERTNKMTLEYFNVFPQYHYSTSDKIDLNPEYHEPWV